MVRAFLCFLILPFLAFSLEITVDAKINSYDLSSNQPIQGTITISHPFDEKVDEASFLMEDEPLKVSFIKNVPLSSKDKLQLSLYQFELPAKEEGLYILQEISVKVGNNFYRSIPSSYEITDYSPTKSRPISRPPSKIYENYQAPQSASLKLEQKVEVKEPFYPGQKAKFIYYLYYSGNIALTTSKFPLLEASGFKKLGDKKVNEGVKGTLNLQEIIQEVMAIQPGDFTFPAGFVEGEADGKKLQSETNPFVITVQPFPQKDKPENFQGAVGNFSVESKLLGSSQVSMGDKLTLQIEVMGNDLDTVEMPNLNALKSEFRIDDLLSSQKVQDGKKRFTVELYPLSENVKEIPAIAFSFFDVEHSKYETLLTDPIRISVLPKSKSIENKEPIEEIKEMKDLTLYPPPAIEIEDVYSLTSKDIGSSWFNSWKSLYIIPLGIFLLCLQILLKKQLEMIKKNQPTIESEGLFLDAIRAPQGTSTFFNKLEEAFLLRLFENKLISSPQVPINEIPEEGVAKEIKSYLLRLEEYRYSGQKMDDFSLNEAKNIFYKIKSFS